MKHLLHSILISILAFTLMTPSAVYAFDSEINSDYLILVNQDYRLLDDYKPEDLTELAEKVPVDKKSIQLRKEAAQALSSMIEDMNAKDIELSVVSGYRGYDYQLGLFRRETEKQIALGKNKENAEKTASTITAIPGASEHQTGLTVDVSNNGTLTEQFSNTSAGKWLDENAYKYGFILRYEADKKPITKIIFEPWHFRYVGKPHAEYMKKNELALEEYIEQLHEEKIIKFTSENNEDYTIYYTDNIEDSFENIIDLSKDNTGGYIITTTSKPIDTDPYALVNGHWSESYIRRLVPEATSLIDPEEKMTRGEFAKLINVSGIQKVRSYEEFSDIAADSPYYNSIRLVFETGIMNGQNGRFAPDSTLTREYAVMTLSKLIQDDTIKRIAFLDTDEISGWAFQDIQKLYSLNLLVEASGDKFRPKESITYGEAAKMICDVEDYRNSLLNN